MNHVAICSLVRDGISYLPSFRRQLESLSVSNYTYWHLYCVEGDSQDGSWLFLEDWAREDERVTVAQRHVGGSVDRQALAQNWALVANTCLDLVPDDSPHSHLLWMESDLCFPPEILRRLLAHQVDVVAPMVYLGGQFYDTWGFRGIDGKPWQNHPPYHSDYEPDTLMPMQSVGSCVLFSRRALDTGIRMKACLDDGLLVGMCHDVRGLGLHVWADTSTAILHPVDYWERQMWRVENVKLQIEGAELIIPVDEFKRRGIERNLPRLDPQSLVFAHRGFLGWVYATSRATPILIEIHASQQAKRRYQMTVSACARIPAGDAAGAMGDANDDASEQPPGGPESTNSQNPAEEFQCRVVIYEDSWP